MKETPVMANQMLSVGRTIWDWAIPLNLAKANPSDKIKDFDIPDRGHVPWPARVIDAMRTNAWPDLVRMVRLGVMTCQRGSDLIRMGPEYRERNGIWCRPQKTKKRRRAFLIPLAAADALELDRWAETPVTFTNSRWLKPLDRFRPDLYLYSPKGAQYTPDGLRARFGRWLDGTPEGEQLCRHWKEWVAGQVKKYEWDIDPEDADHPMIHGLRGTGILARAEQGYMVDQIANDIGMSRQNVEHYMRFKDQMKVAAAGMRWAIDHDVRFCPTLSDAMPSDVIWLLAADREKVEREIERAKSEKGYPFARRVFEKVEPRLQRWRRKATSRPIDRRRQPGIDIGERSATIWAAASAMRSNLRRLPFQARGFFSRHSAVRPSGVGRFTMSFARF